MRYCGRHIGCKRNLPIRYSIVSASLTANCVERSLDIYLLTFEKETEILTLKEASKLTPYTQEYLSLLARKGSIGAFKLHRKWVITKKALNEYLKTHPRKP